MRRIFRYSKLFAFSMLILNSNAAFSVNLPSLLPSTVLPEQQSRALSQQPTSNPAALAPVARPTPPPSSPLGAEAAKVTFRLNKIILEDNKTFTEKQLLPLYQDKLHKTISVVELQEIVQKITNYYRNEGYILTRAVLPPQHVKDGVVRVKIIEGFVHKVSVIGSPKGATPIVQAYGEHIVESKPLQLKVMEKYLLLANELPGVQVKAVLEPSKEMVGASDLNLSTENKRFSGYLSYDNFGTLYIGPNETSAGGEADSIFLPGDSTQVNLAEASRPQQLKFGQILYGMPVGTKGMRLMFAANQARTRPGLQLTPLYIDGIANTFYTMLQYPLMRTRSQNMTLDGSFNYIDSSVVFTQASLRLYVDHLRTLRFGINVDKADSWKGANSFALHFEGGIPVLGYTTESQGNATFVQTSRAGASNHFARIDTQMSRLQGIGNSRYSVFFRLVGQLSNIPLLASEQFSFGGAQLALGRGYDSAEIIGDKGVGGSVELRMSITPAKYLLQAVQLYTFYDMGAIWNNKNVPGQNTKSSITSVGVGGRFYFTSNFSGTALFAQPLTKGVDALYAANKNGRMPRVFFSVSASA